MFGKKAEFSYRMQSECCFSTADVDVALPSAGISEEPENRCKIQFIK